MFVVHFVAGEAEDLAGAGQAPHDSLGAAAQVADLAFSALAPDRRRRGDLFIIRFRILRRRSRTAL